MTARKTVIKPEPEKLLNPDDMSKGVMAARTRMRLAKYGVLQLRVLDMYTLKPLWVPEKIKLNNQRLYSAPLKQEDISASFYPTEAIRQQNPTDMGYNCFN